MSVITAGSRMVGTPINLVRGLIRLGPIKDLNRCVCMCMCVYVCVWYVRVFMHVCVCVCASICMSMNVYTPCIYTHEV